MRTATFPDGLDSLLLNPDISVSELRRVRIRAALSPAVVLNCLCGAVGAALALTTGMGATLVCVCVVVCGLSVVVGLDNAARLLTDHRHETANPWRFDRVLFFRSRDFRELGELRHVARILIDGVGELHCSPARAWIDPTVPAKVHRLVWHALCCLDRTRAARSLAVELAEDPDSAVGDLAVAARESVAVVDCALSEVVRQVNACLVLIREWEVKLQHAGLDDFKDCTHPALPVDTDLRRLTDFAETLPESVFAHITAARDVLGAGSFAWERPSPCCDGEKGSS
ncbi:MAG TPA: hypothetical protein VG674_25570 [Amycolatopsis sp.]|nr:hypothetical protein [Amycolatopsis sp.]